MEVLDVKRIIGLTVVAIASLGCNSDAEKGTQAGELGRGKFQYVCGSTGDPDAQCNENADLAIVDPATNMPAIALGGRFAVTFIKKDAPSGNTGVYAQGLSELTAFDYKDQFHTAKKAGWAALIGFTDGGGYSNARDLVHVRIEPIDHLEVAQTTPTGGGGGDFKGKVTVPGLTVDVTVSSPTTPVTQMFRVVPLTLDRRLLAGALACQWTSSNPSVANITTDPTKNIITVELKPGTATIHVTLGDKATDVQVKVGT
jgi:hypothetical protein